MADISKCVGANCKLRDTCWRYLVPSAPHYQTYSDFQYNNGDCEYYWKHLTDKK